MYASDWIFGLFASVMPLEKINVFFTNFFENKWIFFYQLILSILKFLEQELLQEDELWNILNQIKSQTHHNTAIESSQTSASKLHKRRKRAEQSYQQTEQSVANDNDISSDEEPHKNRVVKFFYKIFSNKEQDMWQMLIDRSQKEWSLDENYINKLLRNFDLEHARFNIDANNSSL